MSARSRSARIPAGNLVGYVVPDGIWLNTAELQQALADALPEPMVPAAVVLVDDLPLTPQGHLDHVALPAPDVEDPDRTPEEEEVVCGLFAEVLGRDVRPGDSFFDLGGDSLQAMRLIARVRAALGVEMGVRTLFKASTPAGLTRLIKPSQGSAKPALRKAERPDVMPLSFAQLRMWFLNRLEGGAAVQHSGRRSADRRA